MENSADALRLRQDLPANLPRLPTTHSGKLPVVVMKLAGACMEFEVPWDESVAEFKLRLWRIFCVTPCNQVLLCGTCKLESRSQLRSHASTVPLMLTLVVRAECPGEVVENTRKLLTAIHSGMAPCPCRQTAIVRHTYLRRRFRPVEIAGPRSGAPALEQSSQRCIHSRTKALVPGRTPAARKLRELRRKALARELQLKAIKPRAEPPPWRKTRSTEYFVDCYEPAVWAGLEPEIERTIQHYEVDLEGFRLLEFAFREGCGELALLFLRHGADPKAVSLRKALLYFRGRSRPWSPDPHKALLYFRGWSRPWSPDPLVPAPEIVFRNPAQGFALARAICDLRQRQAAMDTPPMDPLAAARVALARAATELALLCRCGGEAITKQAVAHAAGIPQADLDAHGDDLWAGWPMAFLTFSEPKSGPRRRLDPDFVRVRACVVASSFGHSQGEAFHWYDWRWLPWREPEPDREPLDKEYDLWKCRNRKWRDNSLAQRRVKRVPWATAKGSSASRSSRLARRLPKSASHNRAQVRHHRKSNTLDWDGELLDSSSACW